MEKSYPVSCAMCASIPKAIPVLRRASCPAPRGEFDLARLLVDELRELGLTDAHVDEHCYVYATPSGHPRMRRSPRHRPAGPYGHLPDLTGKDVNPQILHYDGGELVINRELGVVMDAEHFPELDRFLGEDLIFADGRTLLGADDKGGIAVILQALEDLIAAGTPPWDCQGGLHPRRGDRPRSSGL